MLLWTVGYMCLFELVFSLCRTGGYYGQLNFVFLKNIHIVFHSDCTNLHPHQQCTHPFLFSTSSPTVVICGLFDDGHSDRWGFPGGSFCQGRRCRFDPWSERIPRRRKWQPTPVCLPGKSPGQRSRVGYSSWSHKKENTTELLNNSNADWCSVVSRCGFDLHFSNN